MLELLKSFFSFGLATSVQKMLGFLLLPLYTRFFTTFEFGVIDLIQVVLGITSIFAILQLETSLQRYYYEIEGALKKTFVSTIFIAIIFFSLFLMGILYIFAFEVSLLLFDSGKYSGLIELASFQLPFTNFSMLAFILLRYEKKNKIFFYMVLVKVISMLIAVYTLVVWFKLGIYGVFYSQLISLVLSSSLIFVFIRGNFDFLISWTQFKRALKYAWPQIPARIGSVSLSYVNRFFMVSFLAVSSIGLFSFSLKMASAIQIIYAAFIMAWAPFMFEQLNKPNHKKTFANILLLVSCPIFLLVSLISLFSKEIVAMVGTSEYFDSHQYIGGLSLYFALFIIKEIVDIGPKALERTKFLSYTFFCSVVVNIVALYFLINAFGLVGVVFSFIITNSFLVILSWFVSNKLYFIPFKKLKFLISAIPAFFLAILTMFEVPPLLLRIVIAILLMAYYTFFFVKNTAHTKKNQSLMFNKR